LRGSVGRGRNAWQFFRPSAGFGEGRWTIEAALEQAVPANVLSAALLARFRGRSDNTYGEKLLSAMRFAFEGHGEVLASPVDE
jgi:6-phosphogluconate dehydrogenase